MESVKLRSYTNKHGEKIEVSDSHLDAAIEIKDELQKASPSRRTSWAQHKRMMVAEGFEDSENSEAYRQLIKHEQSQRGILTPVKKFAEMINENKLQVLKDEIGNIKQNKFEAQQDFNKLNRLKRDLGRDIILIEGVERALKDKDFSQPMDYNPIYRPDIKSKYMIACISDLHYGAYVNLEGNYYDAEVAEQLLMDYSDKIIKIAQENNVEEIYVVNLGDLVENDSMRAQNTFNAEKTMAEQISDASELIIGFLKNISAYSPVKYAGFGGNHDRLSGNKNDSLYGSHAVSISNKIIETFIKYSGENIEYVQAQDYDHTISVYDKNFLFVHGDMTALKKNSILAELSALYGKNFSAVIGGHIHHYTINEVGEDKFVATFGSIKGSDEYSLKQIGVSSSRSQGIVLIDEDGEFEIRKVKL